MFLGTAVAPSSPAITVAASAGKGVPYLFTHHNSPAFRIRIPADLQPCLGKTEYRRSLGRCYASEAKLRALRLATAALEVFALAREVVQSRQEVIPHQGGLGTTREPTTSRAGSTPRHGDREKNHMAQGETTYEHGYTPPYQGRALGSLTDGEIRAIAEEALLAALKGANLLSLAPLRERILLGNMPAGEGEELKAIATERETAMIQGAEKIATSHRRQKATLQRDLQRGYINSDTAQATDKILASEGINTDRDTETHAALLPVPAVASISYMLACQAVLKSQVTYHTVLAQNATGDHAAYDTTVARLEERREQRREKRRVKVQAQPPAATAATPPAGTALEAEDSQAVKLVEAIEEMCREKSLDGSWKPKVAVGERHKLELFQAVIDQDGSLSVNAIGPKHLSRFKSMLHLMPASKGKKEAYRDMSLPELLRTVEAGGIPDTLRMKTNTIKTYCQTASSFIKWAARHEYHDKPAITDLLQVKAEKQAHEYRDPYSSHEIAKLFTPGLYLTGGGRGQDKPDSGGKPSRFWVPLLGLFTGARLEELAQLHTDDIVLVNRHGDARSIFAAGKPIMDAAALTTAEEDGETLCLHINKGKPYQRLKTASSRRYLPLSPVLAHDLGFLSYAASVFQNAERVLAQGGKAPGDGRLFPELTRKKETDNFAHTLSKWFNAYRERAGVVPQAGRGKKDFHSFRHTVARWCEENEVPEKSAARFLGHSHDTMTFGRYGTETAAHKLYERISKGYGEYLRSLLDIEGLKAGHWAGEADR